MRIAQVAPLIESVPPQLYGGTERIVSFLTEELVRLGHDVTLFASGDSRTSARLVACCEKALRLDAAVRDALPYNVMQIEEIRRRADSFDIIHFHTDYTHYALFRNTAQQTVTTLHGRLDLPDLRPLYGMFADVPVVSISNNQRRPLPQVNWRGTVYHGLPLDLLPYNGERHGGYLAFLGRISPEKRPDRAIEIATRAGLPLRIAAKIDRADQAYWDDVIAPLVRAAPNVEFIGEVDEAGKAAFLGNALAVLFPVDWPEPFGLVMIEAMACGTPVIAFRRGSVPEVIDNGISGYVVDDVAQAVKAVEMLDVLDRAEVRRHFERRFSAERMAQDYMEIYLDLAERRPMPLRSAGEARPVISGRA